MPTPAIIDSHVHVWDLAQFDPPWLRGAAPVLRRDYTVAQYRQAMAGLNLAGAVYVEINEAPQHQADEAQYIVDLIASGTSPFVAAVIGARPSHPDFGVAMRRWAGAECIRGIRDPLRSGAVDDPQYVRGVRLLGELDLCFDLLVHAQMLDQAIQLVERCPHTRFVLNHCANASPDWFDPQPAPDVAARRSAWERGIIALASYPNVACKISGVAEQTRGPATPERLAPIVDHCLDHFGPQRVIFATNWPVCLLSIAAADWYARVEQIARARVARGNRGSDDGALARRLFHDNAADWYRLGA